jgi:signal transduction histidine kinase
VGVTLRLDHRRLDLRIEDNGSGFDPSVPRDGRGLASLRRRAGELGAALEITSQPGRGTVVTLEVPLAR